MSLNQVEDSYPLSPMQQGMLFNSQFAPGSGVDIEQIICLLNEDLNVSLMKEAWERVVKRHPVLRTCFRWQGLKQPLQDVCHYVSLPFEVHDWQNLPEKNQKIRLRDYLQSDRLRGFNLTLAPFMRIALFRLACSKYQLIWTFHHILLDGRSHCMVLNEVFAYYEAFQKNKDLELPQPRPYGDFIGWLQSQNISKAEAFWPKMLKGFMAPTPFAVTKPALERNGELERYDIRTMHLSDKTANALKSLEKYQITPNTVLQGAWGLLLSRYSGETDVVFGAPRACRKSTVNGADSMVGLFINTLPVRVKVTADKQLITWLQELRSQQIAIREFEHTPLVKVQEWSDVPGGLPLFESILIFENYLLDSRLRSQGGNWEKREFQIFEQTNYPLTLFVYLDHDELLLKLQYSCNRFDKEIMNRMLGHLKTLLEGMILNPEQKLSQISLLTEEERNNLLVDWNATKTAYPETKCVHHLFEQQVEHMSESVAVVFKNKQLKYRELNKRANQLAHKLTGLGVGPDVLVGIFMDRSLEMIVGLLGILKAGGAYVPLDPDYPKARLAFMIEDAQIPVLLTQPHLVESLPDQEAHVVSIDSQWQAIDREKHDNPNSAVTSKHLAYVIYTSGSTGKPKGVLVSHRNVVNFFIGMDQHIGHEPPGVCLAVTTISFDISVLELFWTLTRGFKVVIFNLSSVTPGLRSNGTASEPVDPSTKGDGVDYSLPTITRRHCITHFQCTPSLAQMLISDPENLDSLRSLKKLLLGGEPLPPSLVKQLKTVVSGEIYNMYGPTETTIWSTTCRIDNVGKDDNSVSIGRPIANTELYILDQSLQPVPIGIPGELFIGGHGVVRGYLNRPELTNEKFIHNPFNNISNGTLYRTGDLVRYMEDGRLEFLGRLDHQVKIRGYRIELGEIEAAVKQHPAVREAVVITREDTPGDKRLVAYLINKSESAPSVNDLRNFLGERLPAYMIPSSFVFLKALPLTPNGKVDRRALPVPGSVRPKQEKEYEAPRSFVEKALAKLWSRVLDIEKIGIYDNFFGLGGNSLAAVQVTISIRQTFNVELSIQTIFNEKTLAGLAAELEKKLSKKTNGKDLKELLDVVKKMPKEEAELIIRGKNNEEQSY